MRLRLIAAILAMSVSVIGSTGELCDQDPGKTRAAGEIVDSSELESGGWKKFFQAREIDKSILERISGKSYRAGCPVDVKNLRYLQILHWTGEGDVKIGELICNKLISADLIEIFQTLFEAGYPIERMVLIDEYDADDEKSMAANNSSCFNFRNVAGTGKLSRHAYGMAIDINPMYNPWVRGSGTSLRVSPENGRQYVDRSKDFAYKIDRNDLCYKEFTKHGFSWGGNWRNSKDYQHFEKR